MNWQVNNLLGHKPGKDFWNDLEEEDEYTGALVIPFIKEIDEKIKMLCSTGKEHWVVYSALQMCTKFWRNGMNIWLLETDKIKWKEKMLLN